MRHLALFLAATLLLASCGSDEAEEVSSGVEAAANCLEQGGANQTMPHEGKREATVAARGPDGGMIFLARGPHIDGTMDMAKQFPQSVEDSASVIVWLTPDRQAFAVVDNESNMKDWILARKCALVLPTEPGKFNRELFEVEVRPILARAEWNTAVVDASCGFLPGRTYDVLFEDALNNGIGWRRLDGFLEGQAADVAAAVLGTEGDRKTACKAIREWRPF